LFVCFVVIVTHLEDRINTFNINFLYDDKKIHCFI